MYEPIVQWCVEEEEEGEGRCALLIMLHIQLIDIQHSNIIIKLFIPLSMRMPAYRSVYISTSCLDYFQYQSLDQLRYHCCIILDFGHKMKGKWSKKPVFNIWRKKKQTQTRFKVDRKKIK